MMRNDQPRPTASRWADSTSRAVGDYKWIRFQLNILLLELAEEDLA